MKKIIIEEGVVAKLGNKYWSSNLNKDFKQHVGHSSGFGNFDTADIADPKFCKEAWYMTYRHDPMRKELNNAILVKVKRTITVEMEEL